MGRGGGTWWWDVVVGRGDGAHLDEHLVAHGGAGGLGRGAVDGHGLAVAGELQGELLLHQLLDDLGTGTASRGGQRGRGGRGDTGDAGRTAGSVGRGWTGVSMEKVRT